jgi:CelD/BcsL family acetyltransferase involved in cellulose biosynthesis
MNSHTVSAARLTADQLAAWACFQQADPALHSPFFRPEFAQAVAAVRPDVEVAVLEESGVPAGFLPYHRKAHNVGGPVGGRFSDYQGVIARHGVTWDPEELVRGCGLSAWNFDHLIASQEPFRPYHWVTDRSPYLDLSGGWEGYYAAQVKIHQKSFRKLDEKARRAKKVGEIRVEHNVTDRRLLSTLIDWKRQQYRRTKVLDVLTSGWAVHLLEHALGQRSEAFSGMLSAMYFGKELAAIRLGLLSYRRYHSWLSVYNPDFARLSPGLLFWVEFAKTSDALGIRWIDLGKGPEEYKLWLMSAAVPLAEGSVDLRPIPRVLRRVWRRTRRWVKLSPLGRPLERPARVYFRVRDWLTKS